jgi:hypothetical protein
MALSHAAGFLSTEFSKSTLHHTPTLLIISIDFAPALLFKLEEEDLL